MTAFLRENILFVLGTILLGALIAGASALQTGDDSDIMRAPESGVGVAASTTTPWRSPTIVNTAPVHTAGAAAPSAPSTTTSAPPVLHRVYNREQDDD